MKYLDMLDDTNGWAELTVSPFSGFLLDPASEEHLQKNHREERGSGHSLTISFLVGLSQAV